MKAFVLILAVIILLVILIFLAYYYFAIYKADRALTIDQLIGRLRRNRAAYSRMTPQELNSRFGQALEKSIFRIEKRIKKIQSGKGFYRAKALNRV